MIRKIFYEVKNTSANTTYYSIEPSDMSFLIEKLVQINAYMGEITLTKNKDIKDFIKWYTSSDKLLPYSNKWKKRNTPQSFVSGTINNLLFGNTRDVSEVTAQHLETIIDRFAHFYDAVREVEKIEIQMSKDNDTIMFIPNLLEMKND
jgi:hypothetical protein